MEKLVLSAIAITVLFLGVKFVEKKVLQKFEARKRRENGDDDDDGDDTDEKQQPPTTAILKDAFRDAILIFICCLVCVFGVDQLWPILQSSFDGLATGEIMDLGPPKVFAGQPDF